MLLVTLATFLFYLATILGRQGLSAAIPGIVASGSYTKAQLGRVASAFFIAYAAMQLPCGLLGDRLSAPLMMTVGATGAALMNLLFPTAKSLSGLMACWFLNGFFQAFIGASLMRVIALSVDDSIRTPVVLFVSASSPVGALLTYALTALLTPHGWQLFFRVAGFAMLAVAALWVVFSPALMGDSPVGAQRRDKGSVSFASAKSAYLLCGFPLILIVSLLHGMLKDGLSTWIPTYLTEVFSMDARGALILSMALPVANLVGLFFVDIYTRRTTGNELSGAAVTFVFSSVIALLMAFALTGSLTGTVIAFTLLSVSQQVVNTFIIGLVPMSFRSLGLVATTTGLLDFVIYMGSAVSGTLFGTVSESVGWGGIRILLLAISVIGGVLCLFTVRKWGRYKDGLSSGNR